MCWNPAMILELRVGGSPPSLLQKLCRCDGDTAAQVAASDWLVKGKPSKENKAYHGDSKS